MTKGLRQIQQQISQETARLICEEGIKSYSQAKQKAAKNLGCANKKYLPDNIQIQQSIREHLFLFQSASTKTHIKQLKYIAHKALELFSDFHPRLVGDLLEDTANQFSSVNIHLFTDSPEIINIFLLEHNLKFEIIEKHFQESVKKYTVRPAIQFFFENVELNMSIFPLKSGYQAPISAINNKPMKRATLKQLQDNDFFQNV